MSDKCGQARGNSKEFRASKGYQVTRIAPNRSKIVDMLGLLVRAPRTIAELSELTGMDRTALHWWLRLMTEEGLLRCEKVSRHHVYHWIANHA